MAFLRHMVLIYDISVDSNKIRVVLKWQRLKTTKKVKSFLGLVGYYKQFVDEFTKLAQLLTKLTRRDIT